MFSKSHRTAGDPPASVTSFVLAIMAATLAATTATSPASAAKVVWANNGHAYEYVGAGTDWASAQADALSKGGYLVTITSADEQAFIYDNVTKTGGWGGSSDAETEGVWKWVTGPEAGTAFGYSNWAAGEPNNYGGYEDYLLIGPPGYGWNDSGSRVGDSYAYVIEYDELSTPGAVPEPATWAMLILGFGLLGAAMRRSRSIVRRAFA